MRILGRSCLALALGLMLLSAPACAEGIRIVAIGDSNLAGKGVSSSENYPSQLQKALRAKGYDVRVINEGINGDTSAGVLARVDSAVPSDTRLAIVWVGINDLRAGVPAAQVNANRQAIASKLRARRIKVLLLGPRHGLAAQPQYLTGDRQKHLNGAGYAVIVSRTIGRVQGMIGKR
jgi:lysophospholipase L1-like esterase